MFAAISSTGIFAQELAKYRKSASSSFIKNQGQKDAGGEYYLRAPGMDINVGSGGIDFVLYNYQKPSMDQLRAARNNQAYRWSYSDQKLKMLQIEETTRNEKNIKLQYLNAAPLQPRGVDETSTVYNFYDGPDPEKWRLNVPTYRGFISENLYPGIDLKVTADSQKLKTEYILAPGASAVKIQIRYSGAEFLLRNEDGTLDIATSWGTIRESAPYIYQLVDGSQKEVAGAYRLIDDYTYGFEITGEYDAALPLVIDPNIIWSTYVFENATLNDDVNDVVVNDAGDAFICGDSVGGAWVSRVSAAGDQTWITVLNGGAADIANAIAIDSQGFLYVCGDTGEANGNNFPITTTGNNVSIQANHGDANQNNNIAWSDGWLAKLSSTNGSVVWSTFLGGTEAGVGDNNFSRAIPNIAPGDTIADTPDGRDDFLNDVAVLTTGNGSDIIFVTGNMSSNAISFPVIGSIKTSVSGSYTFTTQTATQNSTTYAWVDPPPDGFVAKFNSNGAIVWDTFLGGTNLPVGYTDLDEPQNDDFYNNLGAPGNDNCLAITTDGVDYIYIAGTTNSPLFDPGTGSFKSFGNTADSGTTGVFAVTGSDAFVIRFHEAGEFMWFSYLGGAGSEQVNSMVADKAGNVYMTGTTNSPLNTTATMDFFPNFSTFNPGVNSVREGFQDCFLVRVLTPTPRANSGLPLYGVLWGGDDDTDPLGTAVGDQALSIDIDFQQQNLFITGSTTSSNFDLFNEIDSTTKWQDVFLTQFDINGNLLFSTIFGGNNMEVGTGVQVDRNGNIIVAGITFSNNFPAFGAFAVTGSFGGGDGFVTKFSPSTFTAPRFTCFINQQYRDFLDREGENGGMQFYEEGLSNGSMSLAQLVNNFIYSPEFAEKNGFLARTYLAFFNNNYLTQTTSPNYRIPSYNYMVSMGEHMQNSSSAEQGKLDVIQALLESDEWKSVVGTDLTSGEYVDFLFEHILARPASQSEKAQYETQLDSGQAKEEELALEFLTRQETIERFRHHTVVVMCYLGLLDREAEKGGFDFYMDLLGRGVIDPVTILNNFLFSPEYGNRLTRLGCSLPQL